MEIKTIPYQYTWPIRHQVMWPNQTIDYVKLPNDEQGIHYGLFVQNHLVSIISVFVINQEAQFRKFATLIEEQGKGYGTHLLTYLFTELTHKKVDKIWCNARLEKAGYYEKFGMIKTEQTFSKGGIPYVIMEKKL